MKGSLVWVKMTIVFLTPTLNSRVGVHTVSILKATKSENAITTKQIYIPLGTTNEISIN